MRQQVLPCDSSGVRTWCLSRPGRGCGDTRSFDRHRLPPGVRHHFGADPI